MMNLEARVPLLIFLTSMASLAFQVLLTRIFSITLWYHFAFMVISIAMLGFASSGTLLALYPGLKRLDRIGWYLLFLGVAMPAGYLLANLVAFDPVRLAWEKLELLNILLTYLCLALPFFFSGLVIATAFSVESQRAGLLYCADLTGAGTGSLGILLLMGLVPPEQGVLLISLLVIGAACLAGGRRLRFAALLSGTLILGLLNLKPEFTSPVISPYKGLEAALRYPGAEHLRTWNTPFSRIDSFRSPAVRYAPGLSLRYQEPLPEQIGISIDGGEVNAITAVSHPEKLAFLEHLPAAVPYALGPRRDVLILDPRGGLPVLMAQRLGAQHIATVESVHSLGEIIRNDLREISGGFHDLESRSGLGRSWLAGRPRDFDLIDITLQGAEPSAAFGIAEDYRFTVEAFKEYLKHLTGNGVLTFNLFIIPPPRTELRILATLATALEELGAREPGSHLAAIRSWGTITILAKRSPLTLVEAAAVRNFAREKRFDLAWLAGMEAEESNIYVRTREADYYGSFRAILAPLERDAHLEGYLFDVSPVRDSAPFFSQYLKPDRISETYRTMGGKWQFFLEEGFILPVVLLQVFVVTVLLVTLPAMAWFRDKQGISRDRLLYLSYFALLGLAYMFVEVALIQKLILPLEHPTLAVAIVLSSMLISSGLGSLLSHRYPFLARPDSIIILVMCIVLSAILLPPLSASITSMPLPFRGTLLCILILIPGSLMGIPFPAGLKQLGQVDSALIPWAWAVNGAFSVLAPLLAVMIAMAAGFMAVLLLGASTYLLAFLVFRYRLCVT